MASAASPKRMVSSVFITLASPYRATVTPQQHTLQTHNAPARDKRYTAVRVDPSGSIHAHSQRYWNDSRSSEPHGGRDGANQTDVAALDQAQARSPTAARPGPVRAELQRDGGNEEVSPPAPLPPSSLQTGLAEDSAPARPSPAEEPLSSPLSRGQTPLYSKQTETRTVSSEGGEEQPQLAPGSDQLMSPDSREVCGFCRKKVALAEPAIEALNRTYHDSCFQCRQCQAPLAGKLYYNKAGVPLCEDCYQASLDLCWACGEVIKDNVIRALERTYHPPCFTCATCHQPIGEQRFAQGEVGEVYCLQDYYREYAPQCCACKQLIIPREDGTDSYTVECLGRSFHEDCYRCEVCLIQLSPEPNDQGCYPLDGRVLCKSCHLSLVSAEH
ncbi:filamin-binding LIM protein 1 [Lampris incognitus]|uniref:filamin-binding LIM protein 1 n=1 Tax=Lampris incognitus TaxID=2546036 RepID=UPI0024B6310A|nr:filamin-binding LIM protein 1 [Lampris incognitus]XP_056130079.1 filamin-binding LIM protein 1 [Lampris incognitus]